MTKKSIVQPVLAVALVAAVVVYFNLSNDYIQSVMGLILYNCILVLGLNFITGLTGQMNLATAGMAAMGAYTYGILTTAGGWNPWVALFAMLSVGLALGLGLGYPSLRLKGFYLALTTIGFSEIIRLLATNLQITGGVIGLNHIERLSTFFFVPVRMTDYFYILLFFTIFATLFAWKIVNSKFGRAFKAIRDNPEAAEASGINVARLKIQAFTLAAIYAAVAGALYAGYMVYINPTAFTVLHSQNYVAMLMIGGIGTVPGNIIGAFIVTALPEMLRGFQDYYWIMFCTVCLVMAIFVPDGLYPLIKRYSLKLYAVVTGKSRVTTKGR